MYNDIITVTVLTALLLLAVYHWWFQNEVEGYTLIAKKSMKIQWANIIIVIGLAFIVKAIIAVKYEGYVSDLNCFRAWSDMVYDNGISRFYYEYQDNGYPPGYMWLLWIVAVIRHVFGIDTYGETGLLMIKLMPILFDLAAGFLIYVIAKKRFSEAVSIVISLIYMLCPIVTFDSAVWGQVDSVFTFMVLLTCYLCMKEKRIAAYFVFCGGALLKFQTIMFAPILIYTIIEQVFLKEFTVKKMVRDLIGGLAAIGSMFLIAAPFGLDVVIPKYLNSLELFEYCTINAYNFWAFLGKNWVDQNQQFLFVKAVNWGTLAIIMSVVLSAFVFFKMKDCKSKYFISMTVLITNMFLFSVRMHERYLFPAVVLTLAAFLIRPCKELFYSFGLFAMLQFLNVAHVFYAWAEEGTTGPTGSIIGATAVATMFTFGYVLYAIFKKSNIVYEASTYEGKTPKKTDARVIPEEKEKKKFEIKASRIMPKVTKLDLILLFAIMLIYSVFALRDLGNKTAPQTMWNGQLHQQIVFDLGESKNVADIYAFGGSYEGRIFTVETSEDGVNYTNVGNTTVDAVFKWNQLKIKNANDEEVDLNLQGRFIRMTLLHNEENLCEMILLNQDGNRIVPVNSAEYATLFDEQDEFPKEKTFRTGTYFDEIYHARTAFEMIHGMYNYENTHPPLGKFFISLGIRIFGMVPFGWRIVGTLFGIGMLPFLYMMAKRLFHQSWIAAVATSLFAFDFMHFTQTRIATIDVYGTFFIIAMFYFMLRYAQTSFYDTEFKKTLIPLGLSGLMMGLGCASKWTAVYAAAGLGVFFFAVMFLRFREYRVALDDPRGQSAGIQHQHIIDTFRPSLVKTLAWCILFFIIIPGTIYLLSYIPFSDGSGAGLWDQMIKNQQTMFNYHSNLEATHPYASSWYEWPTMIRPVFYYCYTTAEGLKEGISAFGNPLVWWAGIFATIYMIYRIIAKRDRISLFLVFAYLVQYLPWMNISRCTFAYHYFPSVPFVTLMVAYSLYCFFGDTKKKRMLIYAYCLVAFALFVLFYPVLSGQTVEADYVTNGLKWLQGWVLIL